MKLKHWMGGMIGALALAAICAPAGAAPLGGAADGPRAAAGENATVQDVRWERRCWRHRGHLHCRRVWHGDRYYYGGYPYDSYYGGYPYDSGPSFGLYFGGGHHHHHHRRHRH
jgi:hypothetical protein